MASWLLGFLASWLLGFSASWLLGFSASWLLGFSASRLLGFLASWLLGFLAFRLLGFSASGLLGFSAFRILCIPSSSSAGGVFPTSMGGAAGPPQPPRYVLDFLQRFNQLHPQLNHQFFEHHGRVAPLVESSILRPSWGGGCRPPQPPRYFVDFLQRFNCTPIQIITSANNIVGGSPQPPRCFVFFFTGIDMPSYLNHHLFDPVTRFVGDARDVGGTCGGC